MADKEQLVSSVAHLDVQETQITVDPDCDSCKYEGTQIPAAGYCADCKEMMCNNCLKVHRKSKVSRNHKILEGEEITGREGVGSDAVCCASGAVCPVHQGKPILFYCTPHEALACISCRATDHRQCINVKAIEDLCKDIDIHQKVTSLQSDTSKLLEKLKQLQKERREGLQRLCKQRQNYFAQVDTLFIKLKQITEQLQEDLLLQLSNNLQNESILIEEHLTILEIIISELETSEKALKEATSQGDTQIFIAIKKVGLERITSVVSSVESEIRELEIDLKAKERLESIVGTIKQFSEVKIRHTRKMTEHRPPVLPEAQPADRLVDCVLDRKLQRLGTYNIEDKLDTSICCITGIHVLPGGRLLICDTRNRTLTLLGKVLEVHCRIKMPSKPWEISSLNDREAVVTLPNSKTVQFVGIEGKECTLGSHFTVRDSCYGVACHRNKIYISCISLMNSTGEVLVTNVTGQQLSRIEGATAAHLKPFKCPFYLAVDNADRLYISDCNANALVCMTESGQEIYTYTDEGLKKPYGLVVDGRQNVYICGRDSNNVQVIAPDGRKVTTLLQQSHGLQFPQNLAFKANEKVLVLGLDDSDKIAAFKFL